MRGRRSCETGVTSREAFAGGLRGPVYAVNLQADLLDGWSATRGRGLY
jgi:hypothetical protein